MNLENLPFITPTAQCIYPFKDKYIVRHTWATHRGAHEGVSVVEPQFIEKTILELYFLKMYSYWAGEVNYLFIENKEAFVAIDSFLWAFQEEHFLDTRDALEELGLLKITYVDSHGLEREVDFNESTIRAYEAYLDKYSPKKKEYSIDEVGMAQDVLGVMQEIDRDTKIMHERQKLNSLIETSSVELKAHNSNAMKI